MRPGYVLEQMATAEKGGVNRGRVLRRLLGELLPYRTALLALLALVVVVAGGQAAGPWLVGRAIDHDIAGHDGLGLARSIGLLVVVYLVAALASAAQVRRIGAVGQHVLAAMRVKLFAKLQTLPLGWFDKRPVGDLMSRVLSDVDTLNQLFSQGLTQLLGSFFGLIGILVAMLVLDVPLALVSFLIIPAMLVTTAFFGVRARAAFRKTRQTTGAVTAKLQEEIVGVRQAQAFNRTEVNIERFRERNAANRDANVSATGVTSAFSPAIDILSTLGTALVIGFGGWRVYGGHISIGLLASFLIYVQQFFRPVQLAAAVFTLAQSALAGSERIYAILDEPSEPADVPGAITLGRPEGRIDFEGVGFAYDPLHPVLRDVSFAVTPGQTVALVGRTGAGKTTIASLIPRLYDVTAGVVKVDGHDVRKVARASLRSGMAVVQQEPFLFSDTLAANIAYGRPEATRLEIEEAAKAAQAHGFIAALPAGYDTLLGESGAQLSLGQKQLVAFARALLCDPRILILDEATANIDTHTEDLIQRALAALIGGRTCVVIAHRLSTIRKADQILVVEDGRIVERGTHDELVAAGGEYARLSG